LLSSPGVIAALRVLLYALLLACVALRERLARPGARGPARAGGR